MATCSGLVPVPRPTNQRIWTLSPEAAGSVAAGASVAAGSSAGASVAGGSVAAAWPPPQAARAIEAMINRDRTYKSFFMVNFLLYVGFGLEIFETSARETEWVRRSPPLQIVELIMDNHTNDAK